MLRIFLIGALLTLTCVACVESYGDVDPSASASVTFTTGFDKADLTWAGATQGFDFSDDGQCSTMKRAAVLGIVSGDSKVKRVIAGKKVTVLAFSMLFRNGAVPCGPGVCLEHVQCESGASFVPELGHHYSVTQSASIDSKVCPIHIVDDAIGTEPASLQHSFHGYCPDA